MVFTPIKKLILKCYLCQKIFGESNIGNYCVHLVLNYLLFQLQGFDHFVKAVHVKFSFITLLMDFVLVMGLVRDLLQFLMFLNIMIK